MLMVLVVVIMIVCMALVIVGLRILSFVFEGVA
jgi:hypothetical protein